MIGAQKGSMSVSTIYDPTPEIITQERSRPVEGGEDGVDDFDSRVPN